MTEKKKTSEKLIAKKDFIIFQNETYIGIRKGDELDKDSLKKFLDNLRTEKVI